VSPRAIQSHLKKLGSVKGAKAAEMAAVVQKEIFKELGDHDTLVIRAKDTRETTYANAKIIEDLMMAQLAIAQKDPTKAFKAATALKALSLAASALERLRATKSRALGLDKENALPDEMPVLMFRDLNKEELKALQDRDEADESDLGIPIAPADTDSCLDGTEINDSDEIIVEGGEAEDDEIIVEGGEAEDDEIIVEGEEPEEPAKPHPEFSAALGGRLVKEAKA
jgi:hypothetical protein